MIGFWSPCRTSASGSTRTTRTSCSPHSSPQSRAGWGWGCRSAVPSSRGTADDCGPPAILVRGRPFSSSCPGIERDAPRAIPAGSALEVLPGGADSLDVSWLLLGLASERFDGDDALTLLARDLGPVVGDRKSTRLNSSHLGISYAVLCLKKKRQ